MNKQSLLKKLFASAAAAALLATALAGCGGAADTHKGLDASLEHAKEAVKNYSSSLSSMTFEFSDDAYSKASVAATLLSEKNGDEDMQAAARNLKLDTIVIADEKGVVTASYPDDLKGKNIKETDYKAFNKVVKGIAVKLMPDPVKVQDSDEYNVNAAVPRADGSGAVIIGYKTKDSVRYYTRELEALGTEASHGCIRMDVRPAEDSGALNAWWVWTHLPRDTRVMVIE